METQEQRTFKGTVQDFWQVVAIWLGQAEGRIERYHLKTPYKPQDMKSYAEVWIGQAVTQDLLRARVAAAPRPNGSTMLSVFCEPTFWPEVQPLWQELRSELQLQGWIDEPTAAKRCRKLGPQGGTLDRVKEARALIEQGETQKEACRRAGCDLRTYQRYAPEFANWEEEEQEK